MFAASGDGMFRELSRMLSITLRADPIEPCNEAKAHVVGVQKSHQTIADEARAPEAG
jgi:hypothetical protein